MTSTTGQPAAAQSEAPDRGGLAAAMLLLLAGAFLRCPPILIHGRMWAEELPVFIMTNWNKSFWFAIQAQHFGYFSIWDNFLAAVAVHWIPLTWAALLFSWSGVCMMLATGYFVYRAEFLTSRTAKMLGVASLLLITPSVETWINLLNSEFFFGIWSAVILLSDSARLRWQRHLGLALAVLSGPVTTLLAPLFFVRAIVSRKRDDITQALIVCIGGLGQIAVAILSSMNDRKVTPNPLAEGAIVFNKNFVELFLTRIAGKAVFLFEDRVLHESTLCFVLFWIILILALIALFQIAGRQRSAFWMLIVAFWLSILETSMALNGGIKLLPTTAGERYAFTPNYLILLALVIGATQMAVTPRRKAARILLGLCLVSGAVEFTMFAFRYKADWQSEPWRQQVLRWERDPSTRLQTMPILWPTYTLPPRQ